MSNKINIFRLHQSPYASSAWSHELPHQGFLQQLRISYRVGWKIIGSLCAIWSLNLLMGLSGILLPLDQMLVMYKSSQAPLHELLCCWKPCRHMGQLASFLLLKRGRVIKWNGNTNRPKSIYLLSKCMKNHIKAAGIASSQTILVIFFSPKKKNRFEHDHSWLKQYISLRNHSIY